MDYFEKADKIFKNIEFIKLLGAKLTTVTEYKATARLTINSKHSNYLGGLHGGVLSGVVDTIAFFPGKLLPSNLKLTTSGFDIKFFRPVSMNDTIIFDAEIIYFGKRRVNVEVNVYFENSNKLISKSNLDLMVI